MKTKKKTKLSSLDSWKIAELFGCHFFGDMNCIPHGGVFYNSHNWEKWGYADAVEFWFNEDRKGITVEYGTINKKGQKEMDSAFACCGIEDQKDKDNIHCQIESMYYSWGMERDGGKSFPEDTNEDYVWKQVAPWIKELKNQ